MNVHQLMINNIGIKLDHFPKQFYYWKGLNIKSIHPVGTYCQGFRQEFCLPGCAENLPGPLRKSSLEKSSIC